MKLTLVPMDFNTLCKVNGGQLALTNYYLDYAFRTEGIELKDGMEVTFYDEGWVVHSSDIVCFNAVLRKNTGDEPWSAEFQGKIYTYSEAPKRKFFNAFLGASSKRLVDGIADPAKQVYENPKGDVLAGIACFAFSPKSEFPNLSSIVGMDANQLQSFFDFSRFTPPEQINGRYTDDTVILRGGSNKVR